MPVSPSEEEPGARVLMRTGTAARLAGLSPSTLRIWEHRYGVVAPPKSAAGQRTYSMKDIERLRLIKRLTLDGHAIGTVANLAVDALVLLTSRSPPPSSATPRVFVVGRAAARKLEGRLRPGPDLVFDDMSHLERDIASAGAADVVVIHVPSLHASMPERVATLRDSLPASTVILLYSFGAEAVAEALRAHSVTVRRDPVAGRELARLIVASRPVEKVAASAAPTNRRQYSDAELACLAEMPSTVACECPRHLAEIVTLLVSFELYSIECESRHANDAALHRHLHEVTSAARTMFEHALARVVIEEGLVLST